MSWRRLTRVHAVTIIVPQAIPTDTASIARGQHLAHAVASCSCHGPDWRPDASRADLGTLAGPNDARRRPPGRTFADADWVELPRRACEPAHPLLVMPSEAFAFMSEADLAALIAYLKQLPPVDRAMPAQPLGPLGRALLVSDDCPSWSRRRRRRCRTRRQSLGPTAEYRRYLAGFSGCLGCHGPGLSGGHVEVRRTRRRPRT